MSNSERSSESENPSKGTMITEEIRNSNDFNFLNHVLDRIDRDEVREEAIKRAEITRDKISQLEEDEETRNWSLNQKLQAAVVEVEKHPWPHIELQDFIEEKISQLLDESDSSRDND